MQTQQLLLPIAALLAVLGLIWVIQRLVRTGPFRRWLPVARPCEGRLRLVESLAIDRTRRLVLLTCDGRDLLVLTGGPNDLQLRPGDVP